MAANPLQKACMMTVLACLLVAPAQADEANPENDPSGESGNQTQNWPHCDFVYIDTEEPYVDPHPECLTPLPTFP